MVENTLYQKIHGHTQMSYKPLPENLKIKESKIDGQGLFTDKNITAETVLGMSHIKAPAGSFENDVIRTPLGGFINHSNQPNSELVETDAAFYLVTLSDLKSGDEITVKYQWYDV